MDLKVYTNRETPPSSLKKRKDGPGPYRPLGPPSKI